MIFSRNIKIDCIKNGYSCGSIKELSDGEASLVSFALNIAFSLQTEFDLLILDEVTDKLSEVNKDLCIEAIRMERKLELAMEGQRWFDLARWGGQYMATTLSEYVDFEKNFITKFASSAKLDAAKTMFPLPDGQIQTMGNDENGNPYLVQPDPWK